MCAVVHLKGDKEKIMMAWSIGCSGGENRSDIVFNGIFLRSDKISGGELCGSDKFQNGSDIIRYPTAILSPDTT